MSILISRCFHTSRLWSAAAAAKPVEKSALAKLRKATGYSFSKCKEALEKHGNDVKEVIIRFKFLFGFTLEKNLTDHLVDGIGFLIL